ncbi:ankyrin repeat domain-containing protein [Candidatus Dependentiae bacterium]|nr:ankyrin repeat domain-containing protein [Candidatus Dependentiae bacterium]
MELVPQETKPAPLEEIPTEILSEILTLISTTNIKHKDRSVIYKQKINSLLPLRLVCKKFLKVSDNLLLQICDDRLSRQFLRKKGEIDQNLEVITEKKLKLAFANDITFYILYHIKNSTVKLDSNSFLDACIYDKVHIARMAIGLGVDINATDNNNNSGLFLTIRNTSYKVFSFLIDSPNVDLNHINSEGSPALHEALSNRNIDFALALLKKGAKYDEKTSQMLTIRIKNRMIRSLPSNGDELIKALETPPPNNLFP